MRLERVQESALQAAYHKSGFGYFMEMGLGKTLTCLAEFAGLVEEGLATRMLVVCPNSFKSGWISEAAKHGFAFDGYIFESGSWLNNRFFKKEYTAPPMLVINYEAIRSGDVQAWLSEWMRARPTYLVFDESIQLKTHNSAQTKAALNITKDAAFRRILSGKPITQGPHDLWAQMRAIGKLDGKNYFAFKTLFCKMGGFKMKQVVGAQNEEYLAPLIEPNVFRATKVDWTDLPPKVYTMREYKMTSEMRAMYREMEEEFVLWLENDENVAVDAAITKYIKLAQIQAGFIIKEDGTVQELVEPARNPRVTLLCDILDNEVVGKATIIYNHRYTYDILSRALVKENPAYIRGGMRPDEVDEQKRRFNEDPKCRVILLQTRAAKYGHTLLGGPTPETRCSTSIVFENTYSLDDRSQLEDRIHRHGQTANSVVYVDLIGTSLDRNAVNALLRKESVFQAVFSKIKKGVPLSDVA